MDDLKIEPRDMWMRKRMMAEKEWYTYLGKYHISKMKVKGAIECAEKIGVGTINRREMPFICKEEIPDRTEMKKLLLAIKEHVLTMVGKEFNVDFLERNKRNGEISAFVLIRKKIKKSKLDPYFKMLKEMENEQ